MNKFENTIKKYDFNTEEKINIIFEYIFDKKEGSEWLFWNKLNINEIKELDEIDKNDKGSDLSKLII